MVKSAKKQRCDGVKAGRSATLPTEADISDIFSAIQKKKNRSGCSTGSSTSNCDGGGGSLQKHGAVKAPVSDGLYRAPEKTLDLSDAVFFDVPSQRQKNKNKKTSSAAAEASEDLLRREGVDRIVTVEELRKITSSNPKAGTTANCPFDCDCCF